MSQLQNLFLQHVAQTSDAPPMLQIEDSEGIYLYDKDGKQYIDLIAGISVSSLGHKHPRIVEAVQSQAGQYMHTQVYGEFVMSPQVRLAKLLSDNLPEKLDSVYFVNSGSEAVEGAMKLAKRFTGRVEIIAAKKAYHGCTHGSASLMNPTTYTQAYFPQLPGIRHIEFNVEADMEKITTQTACVIVEPIQGAAGVRLSENDYLKKLRKRCDDTGTLLVFDEIQTGFGRTGSLWAFEQYGIEPDVLLLAKAMGGGMPIGAFVAPRAMMHTFTHDPILGYITTFGGHPVCCAAALANLEVLLETDIIAQVKKKEALFRKLLVHPAIKEVRSAGLMIGVELESFDMVKKVLNRFFEIGLISIGFLFNDESFRIAPPLIISEEEIKKSCELVLDALTYCQNK